MKKSAIICSCLAFTLSSNLFATTSTNKTQATTDAKTSKKIAKPNTSHSDTGLIAGITAGGVVVIATGAVATGIILKKKADAKAAEEDDTDNTIDATNDSAALEPFQKAAKEASEEYFELFNAKFTGKEVSQADVDAAEAKASAAKNALKEAQNDLDNNGEISTDTQNLLNEISTETTDATGGGTTVAFDAFSSI